MAAGGTPKPVHTAPMLQLEDVTYGYVPRQGKFKDTFFPLQ